jgi:CheY-like chemotaxis protein/two-component sensor histidine kinase
VERNAAVQQRLIEDILDVSRIITGKLRFDMSPIDLAPAIYAAVDAVRPSAAAKGVDLRLTASAEAIGVIGDGARMQQVVWNLVSNAIKFTPRGGRVEVTLQRSADHAEIVVADTGLGIAPGFLPHVFDRFRQGDASTTRSHGGLGLGLAIVRHLTELHGGHVRAESDGEGRGARFTVRLPAVPLVSGGHREPVATGDDGTEETPRPPSLSGISVLVVDDEADTRELFGLVLAQFGAGVRAAGSVREALAILDEWRPDVIVCDIAMPGDDGFAFIEQLRARPAEAGGRVPAAALTALARREDRDRVLAAGYQLHLAKPVEPYALVAGVQAAAAMAQPVRLGRRRSDRGG